ncbi:hypothetical protein AFK68_32395 [Hydrocoleum sp. CS-953]|uniref:hypothetical protein n=1 Tax=Hydrocoleum sp. CS-953 TaxID=1671698 RepID=UPI000BCB82D4|nr:hypothetical protein [Hydrocoleum sp. CS-953]OZH51230.1 hypothetical protein AFK68_32395 [Hydrocoleum sp. CS-953]
MLCNSLTRLQIDRNSTLAEALSNFSLNKQSEIPWLVKLLENPKSPLALPGNINLFGHDCLHLLLARGTSGADEAFVIGFTMGNDLKTNRLHILIFKVFTQFFYPVKYRFTSYQLQIFDQGLILGQQLKTKNIHQFDFNLVLDKSIGEMRSYFGINLKQLEEFIDYTKLI